VLIVVAAQFGATAAVAAVPHFEAPAHCGTQTEFEMALRTRLGDEARLVMQALALSITPTGSSYRLVLQLDSDTRQLEDKSCPDLFRAAVVVAMALWEAPGAKHPHSSVTAGPRQNPDSDDASNPNAAASNPNPAASGAPNAAPGARPPSASAVTPNVTAPNAATAAQPKADAKSRNPDTAAPNAVPADAANSNVVGKRSGNAVTSNTASPSASNAHSASPNASANPRNLGWSIAGSVGLTAGLQPKLGPEFGLRGAHAWQHWGLGLRLFALPTTAKEDENQHGLSMFAVGAEPAVFVKPTDTVLVEAGIACFALRATGIGSLANATVTRVSVGPRLGVAAIPWHAGNVYALVGAEAQLQLVPIRFEITGYGEVFHVERLAGTAYLEAGYRFR
jgi:hypothetical protein